MGSGVGKIFGIEKPKIDKEAYVDEHADDVRPRLYAVLDAYIKKNGIDSFMPKESRPYEYLSDEEREQLKAKAEEQEGDEPKPKEAPPQEERFVDADEPRRVTASKAPTATPPEAENIDSTDIEKQYRDAAMAAALQARSLGLDPADIAPTPAQGFKAQTREEQERELRNMMNFIRAGRRYSGYNG